MGVDGWPGILGGKYLSQPGWKDVVVERLHRTGREGNTVVFHLEGIIAFDLDFCLIFN